MEHVSIPDNQRHEVKGASTATAGQVLKANGDGTTTFVAPSSLGNIFSPLILQQASTAAQTPSALDTPMQVSFGAAVSSTYINLASDGTLTFLSSAYYQLEFNLAVGRTTAVGDAYLFYRLLLNGAQNGPVYGVRLATQDIALPVKLLFEGQVASGNTMTVEIVRDSLGINNGGLIALAPVTAGWSDSASASVTARIVLGAS